MERMRRKLCFETLIGGFPIQLRQTGVDKFEVQYYLQIEKNLNYERAAAKLGQAIMHAAACAGNLDNREKGEK
jgi:hypothetical protein